MIELTINKENTGNNQSPGASATSNQSTADKSLITGSNGSIRGMKSLTGHGEASAQGSSSSPCSARYHNALSQVKSQQWQALNQSFKQAVDRDPSLAGSRLARTSPAFNRTDLSAENRDLLKMAAGIADAGGRNPWFQTKTAIWLNHRLVGDLDEYLSQHNYPYLCSGTLGYLDFLGSHAKAIAKEVALANANASTMAAIAAKSGEAAQSALAALTPVAASGSDPVQSPVQSNSPNLRSGLATQTPPLTDGLITNTVAASPLTPAATANPHDDKVSPRWQLNSPDQQLALMQALADKAVSVGMLKSDVPLAFSSMSRLGALNTWKLLFETNADNDILARPEGKALKTAMIDLEALIYLDLARERTVNYYEKLTATFAAIRSAHQSRCTCSPSGK